jgi:hypothetical protein
LTAAHELIERGFSVVVVEPAPNPVVPKDCAVGGMARTQWSRAARVDNPQQRLENSALAASQPIPRFLGAEDSRLGPAPYGIDLFFKEGSCTWTNSVSVLGAKGYGDIRVGELVELIAQIPEIDPYNRKRLAPVEVVQVIGTWAEDDVPQGPAGEPGGLDVIRNGTAERRVDDILTPAEMEMGATPLERWRRALARERCRGVIEALCKRLEEVCPGQFDFAKTPRR